LGGVCTAKLLRGNNKKVTTAEHSNRKSEGGTTENLVDILRIKKEAAAGRTISISDNEPSNFESSWRAENFESSQRAEKFRIQAAGREVSSPGRWQSRFESRNRQISRNQERPTRAIPQRAV
jgi:hypothetical protein